MSVLYHGSKENIPKRIHLRFYQKNGFNRKEILNLLLILTILKHTKYA